MMRVVQTSWAQQYRPAPVMVLRGCARALHVNPSHPSSTCLHGRLQEAMRDFRSGKVTTLVATDVAGRGLHISRWASVLFRSRRHSMQSACCRAVCSRLGLALGGGNLEDALKKH
jgi:hypothetical protein